MEQQKRGSDRQIPANSKIRFGPYELDLRSAELRKNHLRIRLQEQPYLILVALLERPGEVVLREEIRNKLWPDDTVVEFDHGINAAVKRLRDALSESADKPRYIETLARKGYRFIGKVEVNSLQHADSSMLLQNDFGLINAELDRNEVLKQAPEPMYDAGSQKSAASLTIQSGEKVPPSSCPRWSKRARRWAFSFCAMLLALGGVLRWKGRYKTSVAPRVLRFTRLTKDGQAKSGPLVTDGSRIYFNEVKPDGSILIAQVSVAGGETVPLSVAMSQPQLLDLSKDGTQFLVGDFKGQFMARPLWIQPVAGGSPRRVGAVLAWDAAFSPDGKTIIYSHSYDDHAIYGVGLDGSLARELLTAEGLPLAFRFSPDAPVFRFAQLDFSRDAMSIMEARRDGTGARKMFPGCCGEWTPDGRFFIFQDEVGGTPNLGRPNLWALPEGRSRALQEGGDKPIQLTSGPLDFDYPLPSKDGKGIFAIGSTLQSEIVRYDSRSGEFVPDLKGISAEGVSFSGDGQWVAYSSYPDGMLWRSRTDGSERLQLTFPPMRAGGPRWSPNGKRIVFDASIPGDPKNVYIVSRSGGSAERISPSSKTQVDAGWSPDGNSLVVGTVGDPAAPISIVDLRSGHVSALLGSNGLYSPRWSPDGRYIAGLTTIGFKLMLFDVSMQKWTQMTDRETSYPTWSHNGKYLYFRYSAGIGRLRPKDLKIESVTGLGTLGRPTAGGHGQWFGLAPDDSPICARDVSTQEIYALEMDWP